MIKKYEDIKERKIKLLKDEKDVFEKEQLFLDLSNQFTNFMIFLTYNRNKLKEDDDLPQKVT